MRLSRSAIVLAVALLCLSMGGEPSSPRPVHKDPAALTEATVDALRAFLRADAPAARVALDRIHENCRRLDPGEEAPWPGEIRAHDRSLHAPLDLAREHAGAGRADAAFREFTLMVRACRSCHEAASVP